LIVSPPFFVSGGGERTMAEQKESRPRRFARWLADRLMQAALAGVIPLWIAYNTNQDLRDALRKLVDRVEPSPIALAGLLILVSLGYVGRKIWERMTSLPASPAVETGDPLAERAKLRELGDWTVRFRWPLNRAETLAVAALVVTALGAIPNWVNLLQARGYDAAWLIPALQWVQSARWVIVALFAYGAAVLLVWRFWPLLVRLLKWLGGLPKRFYLWLLWHLVIRPVRDHYPQKGASTQEAAPSPLGPIQPTLSSHLRRRLAAQDRAGDAKTRSLVAEEDERALSSLRSELSQLSQEMQAVTHEAEGALLSLRSVMLKRVEDGAATVEREPRGSEESVGISAFKAKTMVLSWQSVSVLEYLLRLHLSRPGMVIREAMSAPEFPASPLASLTGARREATLKELLDKGFLQEYSWEGDTLQACVSECLSNRSVAEVLFEWLQELMGKERTGLD